jgi:hypothetical protein
MAYIDVPTNTDCVLDGMKVITEVAATCNKHDAGAGVFTIETDGAYRIAMTGLGTALATGDWIILRNSVSTADATINNDGIYEVEDAESADFIEVVKPPSPRVWNVYDDAAAIDVDEIDTFILHPTKRTGQLCVYVINSASTSPEISFEPGGYWAAKPESGLPVVQGIPLLATKNLFQIETAPYLQTEEEVLTGTIDRKGSILMRVIPVHTASGATIKVGFIQLA